MSDDRYTRCNQDGTLNKAGHFDLFTVYNLKLAEKKLGYPLTVLQGGYNKGGVKASSGTHDLAGAVDLAPWDYARKVRVMRDLGFAAWHRPTLKGYWSEHIHCIQIGNDKASAGAKAQVVSYKAGRNGLANNAKDTNTYRPKPIKDAAYSTPTTAPKPPAKPAAVPPKPAPKPTPGLVVETISGNLASYDKVHGLKTRVERGKTIIPAYLTTFKPLWFHFQECAIDMYPELDKRLKGYTRVPQGGRGRQSYYRTDAGIKIIEAKLHNVTHMLLKDTKEFLVIAWEKDGYKGVEANFHSENEGAVVQPLQLRDVMTVARDTADRLHINRANILVTGDSNFKGAALFAKMQGWTEAIYSAKKQSGLGNISTNGWKSGHTAGRRIDVDVTSKYATVLEAEQLTGHIISDHFPHRLVRRLIK